MKKYLLTIILTSIFQISKANPTDKDTTFYRSTPTLLPLVESDQKYGDATIFEDNRLIYYGQTYRLTTRHSIVHIKTAEGLDDNNKVFIQIQPQSTLVNIQARSISSTGTIVELNKSNIKEMKDFEDGGNLKIFAIEGAEVGGQIEYTYTVRTPLYDSGLELFSMDYKTKKGCVIIKSFTNFFTDSKPYNWPYSVHSDKFENRYYFENILPISDEEYSTPKANRVYVEHKLSSTPGGSVLFSGYRNVHNKFKYDFYNFTPAELRKAGTILKTFTGQSDDEKETLRNLTVFLKKKFHYIEDYSKDEYENILAIAKSGLGNDFGLMRMYAALLNKLDIDYEVLISSNKYDFKLDPFYCSRYTLNEFLIYFSKHDTYLYPAGDNYHFSMTPAWLEGNEALIVSKFSEEAHFTEIPSQKPDNNATNVKIDVAMDLTNNTTLFNLNQFGTGHLALSYNSIIHYSDSEEEIKKEMEDLVNWRYPEAEILSVKMTDPEKWGNIQFCEDYNCKREFTASVKSASFFEKAGDKLLLKVGMLLGPQNELYAATERVQPISADYNKTYQFEIRIPIPEGYTYGGEQNTKIDNQFISESGEKIAGFTSTVEVVENSIVIKIYEFYAQINIHKKYYDDYRRIINSAADFNKSIILLTKK